MVSQRRLKRNFTIRPDLLEDLDDLAKEAGLSRSHLIECFVKMLTNPEQRENTLNVIEYQGWQYEGYEEK